MAFRPGVGPAGIVGNDMSLVFRLSNDEKIAVDIAPLVQAAHS